MAVTHRMKYLKNVVYMLDLFAVVTSLVCEVLITMQRWSLLGSSEQPIPVEMLILMRSWRFVRLINHGLLNKRVGIVSRQRRNRVENAIMDEMMLDKLWQAKESGNAYDFGVALDAVTGTKQNHRIIELERSLVACGAKLGEGKFGFVFDGSYNDIPVAVKQIRDDAPDEANLQFVEEATLMAQLDHKHIVKMVGVVTKGTPMLVVLAYCSEKSLLDNLKYKGLGRQLTSAMRAHMCWEIVQGMGYLASRSIVHRDLAARNILLTNMLECKISDFGLSKFLPFESEDNENNLTDRKGSVRADHLFDHDMGPMPIRWLAPEVLQNYRFSEESDVWSFGVTIVELYANGKKPYRFMQLEEVALLITSGGCPDTSALHGHDEIIQTMVESCFNPVCHMRPSFAEMSGIFPHEAISVRKQMEATRADSAHTAGGGSASASRDSVTQVHGSDSQDASATDGDRTKAKQLPTGLHAAGVDDDSDNYGSASILGAARAIQTGRKWKRFAVFLLPLYSSPNTMCLHARIGMAQLRFLGWNGMA